MVAVVMVVFSVLFSFCLEETEKKKKKKNAAAKNAKLLQP